jgi:hypothetical protein
MPTNVGLRNTAASGFTDTFVIQDLNDGGRVIARPPIQGGQIYYFNCAGDDQGYGDLSILRTNDNAANHYDFVRDNQVLTF